MANPAEQRTGRVALGRCQACAVPLPPPLTRCPGCELYNSIREILFWADATRAAAALSGVTPEDAETDTVSATLQTSVRESTNLFHMHRLRLRRDMEELEERAHANARNRRRNREARNLSVPPRVNGGRRPPGAWRFPIGVHVQPPPGWALVWCPSEETLFYWNFMEERTQWEVPTAEAQPTAASREVPAPEEEVIGFERLDQLLPVEESSDGDNPWESPPAAAEPPAVSSAATEPEAEAGESSDDDNPWTPMQVRFVSARYLAQEARSSLEAWEPEPVPRPAGGHEEPCASSTR